MNPKSIKGNYRTNSKCLLGDLHTPVSIYLKVRDMYPQSVLMESSDFHAGENSLSFIALAHWQVLGLTEALLRHPTRTTAKRKLLSVERLPWQMLSTDLSRGLK